MKKRLFVVVVLLGLCMCLGGCALINLPFQILGETLKLIDKLPAPPPGVF